MRVLGISGSLRSGSYNHALLREAAERLPAEVDFVEFERIAEIPAYDADLEEDGSPVPEAVAELREAMLEADAVLIATPEYNNSIPGALKNALDWVSRPAGQGALTGTPAAVIGASTGMFGAVWSQAETRKVLISLGGRVVETELPIPHALQAYVHGRLRLTPEQTEVLDGLLNELLAQVEELREGPRTASSTAAPLASR